MSLHGPDLRIVSLGCGVQSSCLALMAAHGDVGPMPDAAIFADTLAEPPEVYEQLRFLKTVLPFPVYTVARGNLEVESIERGEAGEYVKLPMFTLKDGKRGMTNRQCTHEHKIKPIYRKISQLLGGRGRGHNVEVWIGISLDEVSRMKPSQVKYVTNCWPLIEERMTRQDCIAWMAERGYPAAPRSACVFCPFKSQDEWLRTRRSQDWERAVRVDQAIRNGSQGAKHYLHPSRVPLQEVTFTEDDSNQFENECEGYCGI